jgi:DNA-binding transcriptional LysR family regulator
MPSVTMEWESRLGRRLRVRDLYILSTVVKSGSMARAARQLAMSQPAVSEAIANLEAMLRVPLLERSPKGIQPTIYANAMLKRSVAVFDELKQSVKDVEFLADPTVGEVQIGSPESISSSILRPIIQKFTLQHPRVVVQVNDVVTQWTHSLELQALHDRRLDLVFTRMTKPPGSDPFEEDLNIEILFSEELAIAAGSRSPWAARRKVNIADLANEPWILTGPDTWAYAAVENAFRECGLKMPALSLVTFSVHLRANLLADSALVTAFPKSFLQFNADRFSLKVLPITLRPRPWPVVIATLKHRTLSPVVERFIACARDVARSLFNGRRPQKSSTK